MKQCKDDEVSTQHLNQPLPCLELKQLHRLIKDKFLEITNYAFSPVPNNEEFYYYRNTNADKLNTKHDSDDEVSSVHSGTIEFKQDKDLNESSEPNYLEMVDFPANLCPLFLHFVCSMRYNNNFANGSVKELPTCLGKCTKYYDMLG